MQTSLACRAAEGGTWYRALAPLVRQLPRELLAVGHNPRGTQMVRLFAAVWPAAMIGALVWAATHAPQWSAEDEEHSPATAAAAAAAATAALRRRQGAPASQGRKGASGERSNGHCEQQEEQERAHRRLGGPLRPRLACAQVARGSATS